MAYGATAGASGAAAAAAAMAQAIKASGVFVELEEPDFRLMLQKEDNPLVIFASKKIFSKVHFQYLLSYRGFVFYHKCKKEVMLPAGTQIIHAKKIWLPA